jgi:HEAT repeat protein
VWLKTVIKELASPIASIRYEAVITIGEFGTKEAAEILMKLTSDKDIEIRFAAIHALGKIGGPKVKRRLISIFNGDDPAAVEVAEEALSELSINEELIHLQLE